MQHQNEINQKLLNYIEVRKNLWTATIILTGGLAGLLLNMSNLTMNYASFIKIGLLTIGVPLNLLFLYSITSINKSIQRLLNKLNDRV